MLVVMEFQPMAALRRQRIGWAMNSIGER